MRLEAGTEFFDLGRSHERVRVVGLAQVRDAELHERHRLLQIAELSVRVSQGPARVRFVVAVADLAGDGELPLRVLDGTAGLPEM